MATIKLPGKFSDTSGLTVKQGRLINQRPQDVIPITQAAIMRKERKRQEKIDMMAQAFERGEMMSDLRERMMGDKD